MTLAVGFATAAIMLLAVAVIVQARMMLNMERRHTRRVDQLLDRLAHATGRTWMPPPSDDGDTEAAAVYSGYDPFQEPET